jgi:hypothetical protein
LFATNGNGNLLTKKLIPILLFNHLSYMQLGYVFLAIN